ncbi:MAG: flippase, partial [Pirellulaceae bacterium]|nr:flippase [Pirellulaceae bacterium]
MTGLKRTSKNAAMLLIGTMFRMVAGFAFIVLVANVLGVEGFGKYALVVHYYELFIGLTATGAGILLTRDIARWRHRRDELFASAAVLVSALGLLSPGVLLGLAVAFRYQDDTTTALMIACLGIIPAAIGVLYEAVFIALERAGFVSAGAVCESLVRVGAGSVVLYMGGNIFELTIVMVVSRILLLGFYYGSLRCICDHRWQFSRRMLLRFTLRCRVFFAENWMATIYTSMDVIVLSAFVGETAVGLYSAAWRYVRLGAVVAKSFTTAVFPLLTRAHVESPNKFREITQHAVRVMAMIAIPIIAGVSVLPERVVQLIYKPEFADAAPILQILIWVLLLEFLNPFLSHSLFSQGKQRLSMAVAGVGLATNSVLMLTLVPIYGSLGAATACVSSGTMATICYLYFTRELGLIRLFVVETARISVAGIVMGACLQGIADQSWLLLGTVA